mmetsp:Transcript_4831/g.14998  ORF Transcript_4831/g.14998 Transcript_4831/m.14998 type:complete len:207 (-) Transcript_4831:601-1221(-)
MLGWPPDPPPAAPLPVEVFVLLRQLSPPGRGLSCVAFVSRGGRLPSEGRSDPPSSSDESELPWLGLPESVFPWSPWLSEPESPELSESRPEPCDSLREWFPRPESQPSEDILLVVTTAVATRLETGFTCRLASCILTLAVVRLAAAAAEAASLAKLIVKFTLVPDSPRRSDRCTRIATSDTLTDKAKATPSRNKRLKSLSRRSSVE